MGESGAVEVELAEILESGVGVIRADEPLNLARLLPGQSLSDVRDRLLDERCLRFLRLDRHRAPSPFAWGEV